MDWYPISKNDPLFIQSNNEVVKYQDDNSLIPVFINEAAYIEKKIAMSLTKKEIWEYKDEWTVQFLRIIDS